jgi:lysophospholipase L1-like esterase
MKKRLLAVLLSALLLAPACMVASAASRAPKITKIKVLSNAKSAKVSWKKVRKAKSYQIKYGYTKKTKLTKTSKKTYITLKKLKAGKTLYVKVRAKVGKKFGKYSAIKSVKLKVKKAPVKTTAAPTTTAPTTAPITAAPTTAVPTTAAPTTTEAPTATAAPTTTEAPDATTAPTTTEAPTETTKPQVSESAVTYTLDTLKDSLRPLGRTYWDGKMLKSDFVNSGFEVGMQCKGNIKVAATVAGNTNGMIGVIIDEDFDNMYYIKSTTAAVSEIIPSNLEEGYHKIRVVKLNECDGQTNAVFFKSLTVDGTPSTKPAEKELKIEVYGDSITCGYGVLSPSRSSDGTPFGYYQDGMSTYAQKTAEALNADINFVSRSGIGLEYGYSSKTNVMSALWDKLAPKSNAAAVWDFSEYTPDVVLINLGTNDTSMINNGTNKTTADSVKQSALTLLGNIRSKYPEAKIVWIEGMMGNYAQAYHDGITAAISETPGAYHTYIPGGNSGLDWHPNAAEHTAAAKSLTAYLKNLLGLN